MSENENIVCKIKINRQIYPRQKIETGDWGIISCSLIEVLDGEPKLDKCDCFVAKGVLPEINLCDTYKFIGKLTKDKDYGWQYDVVYLCLDVNLTDKDQQRLFLSHILTEIQVNELYKTLDDPFESIKNENIKDLVKVKGIGTVTAQRIIDKYKDNIDYSEIFIELDGYGLSQNLINKLLEKYGSPAIIIKKVKENPYILADEINGIGWSKADSIALKSGIDKNSCCRIEAYIKYFLNKESEKGNSWVYPSDLLFAVEEMLSEDIDQEQFKNILYSMYDNNILYWNESKTFICLKEFWTLENNIKNELLRLLESENKFEYSNCELVISTLEQCQGWEYSLEQKNAIQLVLNNNISIITGPGGCGKTTVAKAIVTVLKDYTFAQTALAGRAASRLTEVTGCQGFTIHKLLDYNPRDGFFFNKDNQLSYDIVILDETSMVGAELFYQLIQSIESGSKLIMLGDIGQLEAIGLANIFKDMIDSGIIPVAYLNKIHRQAQKSAITTNSRKVYEGEQITKQGWTGQEIRGELQDLVIDIYDDKIFTSKKIVEWFKKEYDNIKNILNIQIIVPIKEKGDSCTHELNNEIQQYYNPYKMGKGEIEVKKHKKTYILREGDKVINIINNYKTVDEEDNKVPIFNGYIGIIEIIDYDYMIINFEICGRVVIFKKYWNNIELAYAITCHKYQGSENKVIIVGLDYSSYTLLTKEWVYTAITRARNKCILCAESSALRYAISNSNIAIKQTFLKELLQKSKINIEEFKNNA
jgi:exodeoxyribonuclease V alpha subunit